MPAPDIPASTLADFIPITMVKTTTTPPAAEVFDGRLMYFPPEYTSLLGTPTDPGFLRAHHPTLNQEIKVRGYLEVVSGANRFVMTSDLSPAIEAQIDNFPDHGWTSAAAKQAVVQAGRLLNTSDKAVPDIMAAFDRVHDAGVTNERARIVAAGGTVPP